MRWPWKKSERTVEGKFCFTINQEGVACAHVLGDPTHVEVKSCDFLPCKGFEQCEMVLRQYIEEHELQGAECTYVLQPGDYRLILIDTPDVPPAEMRETARWAVMDFVDFPVEEIGIDFFEAPSQSGRKSKIYIVATRIPLLQEIDKLVQSVGLKLTRMDIMELALSHALSSFDEDKKGVAFMFMSKNCVHILVTHEQNIYLERSIENVISEGTTPTARTKKPEVIEKKDSGEIKTFDLSAGDEEAKQPAERVSQAAPTSEIKPPEEETAIPEKTSEPIEQQKAPGEMPKTAQEETTETPKTAEEIIQSQKLEGSEDQEYIMIDTDLLDVPEPVESSTEKKVESEPEMLKKVKSEVEKKSEPGMPEKPTLEVEKKPEPVAEKKPESTVEKTVPVAQAKQAKPKTLESKPAATESLESAAPTAQPKESGLLAANIAAKQNRSEDSSQGGD